MFKKIVAITVSSLALSAAALAEPGPFHTDPNEQGGGVHSPEYRKVNGEWRLVQESSTTPVAARASERGPTRAIDRYTGQDTETARALSDVRFQGPGGD